MTATATRCRYCGSRATGHARGCRRPAPRRTLRVTPHVRAAIRTAAMLAKMRGDSCLRLEDLQAGLDAAERVKIGSAPRGACPVQEDRERGLDAR